MSLDIFIYDPVTNDEVETNHLGLVTDLNVTHNLTDVADALGFYKLLWHPYRLEQFKTEMICKDVLPHLYEAYSKLSIFGEDYIHLLPKNGWGTLESLRNFLSDYIKVAKEYPNAHVRVSN